MMKLLRCSCLLWMLFMHNANVQVEGSGRMIEPPSRSSLWRFKEHDPILFPHREKIQTNYDDMRLNCGGRQTLLNHEGKCGVCGDPITATVRENEAGGKYGVGVISRSYTTGQLITIKIEILASRRGYFEFRLCDWNNVNIPITHECLSRNLLLINEHTTQWYLPTKRRNANGLHTMRVKLPDGVACFQCVLQWRYRTGNSWGTENGRQGLGLGQQDEFYGCADIAITQNIGFPNNLTTKQMTTNEIGELLVHSSTTPLTAIKPQVENGSESNLQNPLKKDYNLLIDQLWKPTVSSRLIYRLMTTPQQSGGKRISFKDHKTSPISNKTFGQPTHKTFLVSQNGVSTKQESIVASHRKLKIKNVPKKSTWYNSRKVTVDLSNSSVIIPAKIEKNKVNQRPPLRQRSDGLENENFKTSNRGQEIRRPLKLESKQVTSDCKSIKFQNSNMIFILGLLFIFTWV